MAAVGDGSGHVLGYRPVIVNGLATIGCLAGERGAQAGNLASCLDGLACVSVHVTAG